MDNQKKNVDQEKVKRFNQKLKDGLGVAESFLDKMGDEEFKARFAAADKAVTQGRAITIGVNSLSYRGRTEESDEK